MTYNQDNIVVSTTIGRWDMGLFYEEKTLYKASIKGLIYHGVSICTYRYLLQETCYILHKTCHFLQKICRFLHLHYIGKRFNLSWLLIKKQGMECINCNSACIKKGFYKNIQRYYCKVCHKYQQMAYRYKRCTPKHESWIIKLNNEGNSISSIARLTGLSKATVIRKIKTVADGIAIPIINERAQEYEMDELQTYIKSNTPTYRRYVIYAINKATKKVTFFFVGRRTSENIRKITDSLLILKPLRIYTDRLAQYRKLIPESIHKVFQGNINHIERSNLTLRTQIKRLSRKTICFSRSEEMLEACLKLYFLSNSSLTALNS